MSWTNVHSVLLKKAFEQVLGPPEVAAMAFVRCLTPDLVESLGADEDFLPTGWQVWRVADTNDSDQRTITADQALDLREGKGDATLLLVDTARVGAGIDGIYSATREITEDILFASALSMVAHEVTQKLSRKSREYAERAIKKARGVGRLFSVSPWTEFDFLARIVGEGRQPGSLLYLLGLWPVKERDDSTDSDDLDKSRFFVERLLGTAVSGLSAKRRIESLKLLNPTDQQLADLERFLRSAATKRLLPALAELSDKTGLWINELQVEGSANAIQSIELVSWRNKATGKVAKWSGLIEEEEGSEEPPVLILNPEADKTGDYAKLDVRWKTRPEGLEKGIADYQVAIVTDMDEELTSRDVPHSGKKEEKCSFTNDDFSMLSEDALISARVVVSVIGSDSVEPQESEEIQIRFGHPPQREAGGVGKKVRTFAEGVIELEDRDVVTQLASAFEVLPTDSKGYVLLRTPQRGKTFRVFRPPLLRDIEQQWDRELGAIGRWRVKVRASGLRAAQPEFIPINQPDSDVWSRASTASRRLCEQFASSGGGVGQIYDEISKPFENVVKEYLLAWEALLKTSEPSLALANTLEVQSLSGRTIGLIVLPSHPLRVAWHAAYDNLVLWAKFQQNMSPKDIRDELSVLDAAMFPAFLPGFDTGKTFVFADTLGFHTVGMVPDDDKEPKAAVAILARALGESESSDTVPTVGRQSAHVLGNEILKYLECHTTSKVLHIHALRPGDGLTVARSLGRVQEQFRRGQTEDDADDTRYGAVPAFALELYPSYEQRALAGRFIAEAREKRRSGAGVLASEDQWMLESLSLPCGMNLPRLRWARKQEQDPKTAAHLAVAFDTFESRVVSEKSDGNNVFTTRPLFVFGLLSFFERDFVNNPWPLWRSVIPLTPDGEKHPSDRSHTDRLVRLQQLMHSCVNRSLNTESGITTLRTEISPEKAHSLQELHRLCDWVITIDRNAGIDYFDSPRNNKDVYDAYVIDCVPEREDMGCLQLITSTSNLEEVRNLLDGALDQMGLSLSRRNAEFLLEQLKALSGRLVIRLTGQKAPTSELIALALSHANCRHAAELDNCWISLRNGFIIPVDDVRDLLPPLTDDNSDEQKDTRPDLIYVTVIPRKGLCFQFIEVKYRRHLRAARTPELLEGISQQIEAMHTRWDDWYTREDIPPLLRVMRRVKLARVLRFYADKAHRHYLPTDQYRAVITEINRMIERGSDYSFASLPSSDRGWIFCPEYSKPEPLEITPDGWDTKIFLFGPGLLPDSDFREERPEGPPLSGKAISEPPGESTEEDTEVENQNKSDTASNSSAESDVMPTSEKGAERDDSRWICLGRDVFSDTDVLWPLTIKGNPHLLLAGLPGMGKTTCLINICRQMLEADIRPIVFSYHQDIDQRLETLVQSVRFIDFHELAFNPLQVIDRSSRMAYLDVAGALRDIFAAIYPELGDIQGERIRRAIKESFVENDWDDHERDLDKLVEPKFSRFVEILRADPKPDRGLKTLLARLDELGDYGFFDLSESQESLWDSDRPIVIRIHSTQNDNLQKAFASLVFYGLYKDMFRRGTCDRITHALVFDEAHRAARLRLIPTMAKECRKYGISLVLASQEARDFNSSLFSAVANYLVLKLNEADAKALMRNVASSDQERVLIDKIKQMDRFKALYFCEGKKKPASVALPS